MNSTLPLVIANAAFPSPSGRHLAAVALVSAGLLMTELALTRIFSVIMYYHFAFLAISIALFGLSASGVSAYLWRHRLGRRPIDGLLARQSVVYAAATVLALFALVRLRVGLTYSPRNLELMLLIYALAALPFFAGGLVLTIAISRFAARVNAVYAADLSGAAAGCVAMIPLLDWLGAPGVVLCASALAVVAGVLFAPAASRRKLAIAGGALVVVPLSAQLTARAPFDVRDTKGHQGDRVLFSKWNSFSRVAVYDRPHGDWSLSPAYQGGRPDTRFMDIDSAASTPILSVAPDFSNVQYLRYELTSLAYHIRGSGSGSRGSGVGSADSGPAALVIGPGGGRDLVTALVFGARRVDGVEINPIIANDVMRDRFRDFSGGIYSHPRVRIVVDDGRSFVSRTSDRYDVIQASLVDTWAATAAGAYTLTENTLYTVEAFNDYLDHLNDDGILTITRWVFDGLRLVSLAQEACAARGWDARQRIAIVEYQRVITFLLKKAPFTNHEIQRLQQTADALKFHIVYAPEPWREPEPDGDPERQSGRVNGIAAEDYARLILAPDRRQFYAAFARDIRPTTDDRPFFFHTIKLTDQLHIAFGRSMLFGNGLSALLTLMGISTVLLTTFVIAPLALTGGAPSRGWPLWLMYFGALGAGFMLIEVSMLQRLVLLLGHPLYSLTVTLFALLLGTGAGSAWSRRVPERALRPVLVGTLAVIAVAALLAVLVLTPLVRWAIPFSRVVRMGVAAGTLLPLGMLLGIPMPAGIRILSARAPDMVSWAWGINGALSVLGATVAIFVAMNWGFGAVLATASAVYALGLCLVVAVV
jgi:spermidine synthase